MTQAPVVSSLAVGIDVGVHKGLDVVVLEGRLVHRSLRRQGLEDLYALLTELQPAIVAIDSPPGYLFRSRAQAELTGPGPLRW